jgi:hypothetical protein
MQIGARTVIALVLSAVASLVAGGCVGPRVMDYWSTGRTVEIDGATGDTVITQFWKFANGETAVTFKRIPRGNTDTRREAPPPVGRFVD